MNQKIMLRYLAKLGYSGDDAVTVVEDGMEAVKELKRAFLSKEERPYDLVLMDCLMPSYDGYWGCKTIRSLPYECREVNVVAVTASTLQSDIDRAAASGFNGHLAKPFTVEELEDALGRWLPSTPSATPGARLAPSPEGSSPRTRGESTAILSGQHHRDTLTSFQRPPGSASSQNKLKAVGDVTTGAVAFPSVSRVGTETSSFVSASGSRSVSAASMGTGSASTHEYISPAQSAAPTVLSSKATPAFRPFSVNASKEPSPQTLLGSSAVKKRGRGTRMAESGTRGAVKSIGAAPESSPMSEQQQKEADLEQAGQAEQAQLLPSEAVSGPLDAPAVFPPPQQALPPSLPLPAESAAAIAEPAFAVAVVGPHGREGRQSKGKLRGALGKLRDGVSKILHRS
jgi:CheY-like chemotaxis protein